MNPSGLRVACLWLPRLGTALARRDEPSLADRPLATVSAGPGPARLVEVCRLAHLAGLGPGMTLPEARFLCPELVLRPDRPEERLQALELLLQAMAEVSPSVEPADLDRVWIDLAGLAPGLAEAAALGRALLDRAERATGLRGRIGLAGGKVLAQGLTQTMVQSDVLAVAAPHARGFLQGLPLRTLPLPPAAVLDLRRVGVRKVGQFAALPGASIRPRFGEAAWLAYLVARGWDDGRVQDWRQVPRLAGWVALPVPLGSMRGLRLRLDPLARRLALELALRYRLLRRLRLELRGESGPGHSIEMPLAALPAEPERLAVAALALLDGWPGAPADAVAQIRLSAQGFVATPWQQRRQSLATLPGQALRPGQAARPGSSLAGAWAQPGLGSGGAASLGLGGRLRWGSNSSR